MSNENEIWHISYHEGTNEYAGQHFIGRTAIDVALRRIGMHPSMRPEGGYTKVYMRLEIPGIGEVWADRVDVNDRARLERPWLMWRELMAFYTMPEGQECQPTTWKLRVERYKALDAGAWASAVQIGAMIDAVLENDEIESYVRRGLRLNLTIGADT